MAGPAFVHTTDLDRVGRARAGSKYVSWSFFKSLSGVTPGIDIPPIIKRGGWRLCHLVAQFTVSLPSVSSIADALCARRAPVPPVPARASSSDFPVLRANISDSKPCWPFYKPGLNKIAGDGGSGDQE